MSGRPTGVPNVAAPPGLEDEQLSAGIADLLRSLSAGLDPMAFSGVTASAPARANVNAPPRLNGLTTGLTHGSMMHSGLGRGLPKDFSTSGGFASGSDGLATHLQQQQQQQHRLQQVQQIRQPQAFSNSGEWVEAVLSAAPLMDSAGLKEALAILDNAVSNIQQIKALDGIISSTYMAGGIFTSMPHLHAAECMKAQVYENQQLLLRQLHHLRARAAAMPRQALNSTEMANVVEQAMISQQMAQQQDLRQLMASLMSMDDRSRRPRTFLQERQHHRQVTPDMFRDDRLGNLPKYWQEQHQQWGSREMQRGNASAPWPAEQPHAGLGKGMAGVQSGVAGQRYNGQATVRPIQTLSTSLQLLANEDPDCLFIVRRINKLGFKASKKLKQHFSSCGTVIRILVAHSTVRQHGDAPGNRCQPRRRPSSLGFVHMATREAVYRVLALGEEQLVENSVIRVQKFERPRPDELEEEEDDDDQEEQEETDGVDELTTGLWNRQQSAITMEAVWKREQSSISAKSTNWENEDEEWKRQQSAISAKSTGSGDSSNSRFEGSLVEDSSEQ